MSKQGRKLKIVLYLYTRVEASSCSSVMGRILSIICVNGRKQPAVSYFLPQYTACFYKGSPDSAWAENWGKIGGM